MMLTDDQLFACVADEYYGHSTVYNGSDPLVDEMLNTAKKFASSIAAMPSNKPNTPTAYINVVDYPGLAPCAYSDIGKEGIALTTGTVNVLRNLFNHILAHPKTFASVGNSSLETQPPPFRFRKAHLGTSPSPIDKTRVTVARLLYRFALEYILLHEIGHYHYGHNRLRSSNSGLRVINEFSSSKRKAKTEFLKSQALEMNADAFAVAQGLKKLEGMADDAMKSNPNTNRLSFLQDMLQIWLYATCGLFRFFAADRPFIVSRLAYGTHPPARIRLMWVIQTAMTRSRFGLFELPPPVVYGIAMNVANEIERDISFITRQPIDMRGISLSRSRPADKHLGRVIRRYRELSTDLDSVSYSSIRVINRSK